MLRGISLTTARDIDAEDFLTCLGAEPLQLDEGYLYKDWRSVTLPDGVKPWDVRYAMYGICGNWVYALEDWGMATWHLHRHGGPPMTELAGVETICVSRNMDDPPPLHLTRHPRRPHRQCGVRGGHGLRISAGCRAARGRGGLPLRTGHDRGRGGTVLGTASERTPASSVLRGRKLLRPVHRPGHGRNRRPSRSRSFSDVLTLTDHEGLPYDNPFPVFRKGLSCGPTGCHGSPAQACQSGPARPT